MIGIGQRIINLRERKGWTQRELARRLNLNYSVMNRIESGDRPVKDQELIDLANTLGVSTDYLLGRTDSPEQETGHIDEEIKNITDKMQVWYKNEPENKELKLDMLKRMLKSFEDDQ